MRLAVIPARGGSKRIPRKNIRVFAGRPMVAWSIRAALECGCFDKVLVSTDDEEVADVARSAGAEAPFLRPAHLSDDYTPTAPVIKHAIEWAAERWGEVDETCCIYATAPLLDPDDLRNGLQLLLAASVDFAISVTPFAVPIQRALSVDAAGALQMVAPEYMLVRSQDLPESWHDAGQFYWGRAQAWRELRPFFGGRSVAVRLPRSRVQDIDTPEDWEVAEALMHRKLRFDVS